MTAAAVAVRPPRVRQWCPACGHQVNTHDVHGCRRGPCTCTLPDGTVKPVMVVGCTHRPAGPPTVRLPRRQAEVLRAMAAGHTNAEIGVLLFVSEDTVKSHARRLFVALGARDRAHAVARGYDLGLLEPAVGEATP